MCHALVWLDIEAQSVGDHVDRLAETVAQHADHCALPGFLGRLAEEHDLAHDLRSAVASNIGPLFRADMSHVAREGGDLLSFIHAFKRQSGFALVRLGKSSPVWHRELWDRHTRSDAGVEDAVDYILRNPVEEELCERPEDLPHSEFHGYPW